MLNPKIRYLKSFYYTIWIWHHTLCLHQWQQRKKSCSTDRIFPRHCNINTNWSIADWAPTTYSISAENNLFFFKPIVHNHKHKGSGPACPVKIIVGLIHGPDQVTHPCYLADLLSCYQNSGPLYILLNPTMLYLI